MNVNLLFTTLFNFAAEKIKNLADADYLQKLLLPLRTGFSTLFIAQFSDAFIFDFYLWEYSV